MQGWARLNPQQRERFFKAGLKERCGLTGANSFALCFCGGSGTRRSPLRSI